MREIKGKAAVVTGGGSGIGRAIALALAREGASVVVADILPENAERVAGEIRAAGGAALPLICDVSDRAAVARLKAQANEAFGVVSVLVANAGATAFQLLDEMSDDDVDWIVQANLMHVLHALRAFLPDMYAAGDGHVVATASSAALLAGMSRQITVYTAVKAGIIGLMMSLKAEAADRGVGSTVLVPGGVTSEMQQRNGLYRPQRFGGPGEGEVKVPKRAAGAPAILNRAAEEVADMVVAAIRENRPVVVTDPNHRDYFFDRGYARMMRDAFDTLDAFDRELTTS